MFVGFSVRQAFEVALQDEDSGKAVVQGFSALSLAKRRATRLKY